MRNNIHFTRLLIALLACSGTLRAQATSSPPANPTLAVGGLKEVNGDDNRFTIGTEIPLELFGRRAHRTEVAELRLTGIRATVTDKERLLAGEVLMRFAETLAAARNVEFVEQLLRANQEFLKLMEDRVREGAIPSLDAEEVRVETNRIESLRIDYRRKRRSPCSHSRKKWE